jgi:succinate-semialdehyde dehydrogenase/glutarate-semialdehyde dehydrogenase
VAETAETHLADEKIAIRGDAAGTALVRTAPLGVLLGVMPWNFPAYQVARFAGPNLAIGNTILLKHASQCPESARFIAALFHEAGFPPDAYVNVFASTEQVAHIIGDPRVAGVSLTGSERAGRAVAEAAGRHLKKVVLELGGSDPFLVLSTNDMDDLVEKAIAARLDNNGQACNAAKRFIVVDELYERFLDRFSQALLAIRPEDPTDPRTRLGPLSSAAAAEWLDAQVAVAVANGATARRASERQGTFFSPVVLTDVAPGNPAYDEEFFGPVATVHRVADEAEAVRRANDTPFGLGSYVFTTDEAQALRVADELEAGMVFVNAVMADGAEMPFGGVKRSGVGRELGRFAFNEFVNKKLIRVG